jgi:hypothetical protein
MNQEYDVQLSFEELVHACDNDRQWVVSLIEENAHQHQRRAAFGHLQRLPTRPRAPRPPPAPRFRRQRRRRRADFRAAGRIGRIAQAA